MRISIIFNFKYTIKLALLYFYNHAFICFRLIQLYVNKNKIQITSVLMSLIILGFFECVFTFYKLLLMYAYWFVLGVLSTIGIGFGLQTGAIFVVPFVLNNYNNECNKKCNIINIYLNCLPVVIVWAIGSAFGELPPYVIAKNSNLDYKEFTGNYNKFLNNLIEYTKSKIKKNSFMTILVFSCWPSITFDMCGLLCGYCKLSLRQFLLPTIIGKAFIKAPIMLILVLYFYHKHNNLIENNNTKTILNYIPLIIIGLFTKSLLEDSAKKQEIIMKKKYQ